MQFAGTLTPPAFPREYPYASAGSPRPARACGAPPPPKRGRGQCLRYQGSSRIRGVAGGPPCPALLRDLPVHWTVGISPRGEGLTGRGNSFPLPCLSRSNHLASRRSHPSLWQGTRIPRRPPPPPPRLRQGIPVHFCQQPPPLPCLRRDTHTFSAVSPHPARACSAPPPPPSGGRVRAWRYQGSSRARGGAGGKSYLGWSWWETVPGVEPVGRRARLFSGISPCTGPW